MAAAALRAPRHLVLGEPREPLVAHRQVIDSRRDGDRRLLHIIFDDPLVGVEVRVPRIRRVLDRVLEHADPRQPGLVEGRVIRPPTLAAPRRRGAKDAEVREGREGLTQNRARRGRPEHRHPTRTAGAVVDIEVAGKFLVRGLRLFSCAEVLLHVRLRTQQPLLLSAPESHANRSPRLNACRHQNARRLHHHGASDRIVGGASRGVPRVEMPAEHDDLVSLVRTGDLRNDVVAGPPLGMRAIDDVELEFDAALVGKQTPDTPVVLVAHHDRRRRLRHVVSRVVERANLAVVATGVVDPHDRTVGQQELIELLLYLIVRQRLRLRRLRAAAAAAACGC